MEATCKQLKVCFNSGGYLQTDRDQSLRVPICLRVGTSAVRLMQKVEATSKLLEISHYDTYHRVATSAVKLLHKAEAASILLEVSHLKGCRGWHFILHNVEAIGQSPKTCFLFYLKNDFGCFFLDSAGFVQVVLLPENLRAHLQLSV